MLLLFTLTRFVLPFLMVWFSVEIVGDGPDSFLRCEHDQRGAFV